MMISYDALKQISEFEGFQDHVYRCSGGYMTIGFGHVIRPGEEFPAKISKMTAMRVYQKDIREAEHSVVRLIDISLTQGQFDALVSFCFNMGSGALQRSTLRRRVNTEEHDLVPAEFLRWCWAGGCKLKGLLLRRQAEVDWYTNERPLTSL